MYFLLNHEKRFLNQINTYLPNVDYCSFNFVNKYTNITSVTRNVLRTKKLLKMGTYGDCCT